ncbi:KR domain-containing protein [Ditylenchus destructor]|nr:KR domain-containing protein [Ditylenchus destructor]
MDNNSFRRIQHRFCITQYEYLSNHCLNGRPVIPGLTLLNLLRSYFDKEQLSLRNINFHEIIPFTPTTAPVIEINFENLANEHKRQDDHQLSVTISNYGQNNSQILSAVLECTINQPIDITFPDHLKTSWDMPSSVKVPKDEFYWFMSSCSYEYSLPFCSIVSVIIHDIAPDKSIGSCKLMPTTKLDVIIDGLLQAMVFTILRRNNQMQMIVPFCIGSIRFEELLQRIVIDTSRWTFSFEVNPQKFIGNCTIIESGTNSALFIANNVLFRPANRLEPINVPKSMFNLSKTTKNTFGIRSIACRLPPNISSASEFWQFLVENDGLVEGGHFLCQDVTAFDAAFFGISRVEAKAMDPQQRLLLECVFECMENANKIDLNDTGFFIGFMGSEYMDLSRAEQQSALTMLGSSYSIVSGRLSHFYNSRGPSVTVDTACSSSLVAMDLAIQAMNAGRCSRAIVAGVNLILTEKGLRQRANGKMLAWDGCCRTFDANACGYGRADGCVVMLLEKITKENSHLFEAEIQAIYTNHDGRSTALTAPNPAAQAEIITKCIKNVESDQIYFWECHGTGTALGDPIEVQALARSLNSQTKDVTISSAKASIGHSEAASGLVGVLKAIKQLQDKYVPAMPHFHVINPQIKRPISVLRISAIGVELDECDVISGGVCSFGIGGTNVLPVSGKSRISLERNIDNYINCIEKPKERINVTPFCAAAALHRNHYQHRAAVIITYGSEKHSKKIIKKNDAKDYRQGFLFEVGWWDELNFDFLLKIPEYAKQFEKLIQAVGFELTDLFEENSNLDDKFKGGIVKVADSYAKFKSLIEYGIIAKEFYSQQNTTKFSENMKQMLAINPENREDETQLEKYFYRCMDSMKHEDNQSIATNGPYGKLCANTTEDFEDVIATAYVQGADLNWQKIYSPGFLSQLLPKVLLPNYAWDRKEFWSTQLADQFDHPLAGNVTEVSECFTIFENLLSTRRLPFLKSVKYMKKPILSFGCIVEIIIASTFHHFERTSKAASSISIEKFHIENLSLPQETDIWMRIAVKNYESSETSNNEEVVVVELSQTVPNSTIYNPMCSALVRKSCNVNGKRRDLPQPQQKLDLQHFHSIIAKNTSVEYRVDDINIELDSHCNIARISTCQLTHHGFHIHPLLMEAFVQILQHYGTLQAYEEFEKKIKQIQISSDIRVNNLCYVNVEENVVESFDEHGNMIIRILVDVDSDILTPTEDKIERGNIENSIITQENLLSHETTCYPYLADIINKVKEAVEDAVSQEQQLAQIDFDTGFMDLGLDSLALIGFVNKLNESYFPGQLISSTDVFSYSNINALSSFIYQRQKDTACSTLHSSNAISCLSDIDPGSEIMEFDLSYSKEGNAQNFALSSHAYLIEELDVRNKTHYSKQEYVSFSFVDDETNIIEASKFIRAFAKILITSTPKIYITIPPLKDNCTRLNGMARGFFKSLAAEKRNKIIYDHHSDHYVHRLSDLKCSLPRSAPSGNWLITGGTSGLGFEMLKYLVDHYHIGCIVVISRRPFTGNYADEVSKLQRFCEIEFRAADVSNLDEMRRVFASVQSDICGRLDGVIHSAGVVQDAIFECQTDATFEKVLNAKCIGVQNLEILLAEYKLSPRFFIINSSISSILGNTGQTNYAAANGYVDEFIRHRRAKKLNGTSINWGNWLEVGMAERSGLNASLKSFGFSGLAVNEAMIYFRYILESNPCVIAVAKIDWDILLKNRPDLHGILENTVYNEEGMKTANEAKFENNQVQLQSSSVEPLSSSKIRQNLDERFTSKADLENYLIQKLRSFIANTASNQEDLIEINPSQGFMEVGFDSFRLYSLTTQLNSYLQSQYRCGFSLSVVDLFEHSTPAQLSEYILDNVKKDRNDYSNISEDAPEAIKEDNSERCMTKIDMEYITDHVIGEQVVVPAAYQIHCMENHFATSFSGTESHVKLEDITFTQIMTEKHLMSLVTTASPSKLNSDTFNVALTSCEQIFSTSAICLNPIKCVKHDEIQKFISDILNESNGIPADVNNFYREMCKNGIQYGNSMRLLRNVKVDQIRNTVIGKVEWNPGMPIWLLYELALQALSMALFDERMTYYYVPTYIKTHAKNLIHFAKIKEVSVYGKVFHKTATYVEGSVAVETRNDNTNDSESYLFMENIRAVKMYGENVSKEATVKGFKIYKDVSKKKENYERRSPSSDEELSQYFDIIDSNSPTIYANKNLKYEEFRKEASQVEQEMISKTSEHFKTFENSNSIFGGNEVQKLKKSNLKQEITQVGDTIAPVIVPSMCGKILIDDSEHSLAKCSDKNDNSNFDLQNTSNELPVCPRKQSQIDVIIRGWNQSTFNQHTVISSETKFCKATPIGLPPVEDFDCQFFNITPKEAPFVDPQQRWLLEAAVETMEHASLSAPLDPNTGVFIGCSSSDFAQKIHSDLDCCNLSGYLAAGTNGSVLAGRLAHFFGFIGPAMTFDTGCSSFTVALASACDALVDRKCRFALVGAVNVILNAKTSLTLSKCGMLSPQHRCATFDADADGYLRGEGVAMVLIEGVDLDNDWILDNDEKRCLTESKEKTIRITGWSSGHTGGDSAALTVPSTAAQCRVMETALQMASRNDIVEFGPIDLVECHGSGTALGDPIEVTSILDVFTGTKHESLILAASKTRFGHCEAAAGGMALVNLLNNIQDEYIPPINHFKLMNTHIRDIIAMRNGKDSPRVLVPIVGTEFKTRRAMVNSFGFSGVNSAVIIEATENQTSSKKSIKNSYPSELLAFSAKSAESLKMMIESVETFLHSHMPFIPDLFQKLQANHGKPHYFYRHARIVNRINDSIEILEDEQPKSNVSLVVDSVRNAEIALAELLQNHRGFRQNWNKISTDVQPKLNLFEKIILSFVKFFVNCNFQLMHIFVEDPIDANKLPRNLCSVTTFSKEYKCLLNDSSSRIIRFSDIFQMDEIQCERPSLRLNRLFGQLFMAKIHFDIQNFELETSQNQFIPDLPSYHFDRKRYWPFDKTPDLEKISEKGENNILTTSHSCMEQPRTSSHVVKLQYQASSTPSTSSNRPGNYEVMEVDQNCDILKVEFEKSHPNDELEDIFYQLYYQPQVSEIARLENENLRFGLLDFIGIDDKPKFTTIKTDVSLDAVKIDVGSLLENEISNVVLFWQSIQCDFDKDIRRGIQHFMNLSQLFIQWPRKRPLRLVTIVPNAKTTEFGAFIRSVAAEYKNVSYRVVCLEEELKNYDLDNIIETQFSLLTCIEASDVLRIANDGTAYAERLDRAVWNSKLVEEDSAENNDCSREKVLITGGLGGIGQEIIRDMKAVEFAVVSRGLNTKCENKYFGKTVKEYTSSCEEKEQLRNVFKQEPGINTVIHCAGVVRNSLIENLTYDAWNEVFKAKVTGTKNLLDLCEEFGVPNFIAISSIASIFGSIGQCNYAVANALMTKMCFDRENSRTKIKSISVKTFGPWAEVGMLAGKEKSSIRKQICDSGWDFIKPSVGVKVILKKLKTGLPHTRAHGIAFLGDWRKLLRQQNHLAKLISPFIVFKDINSYGDKMLEITTGKQNIKQLIMDKIREESGIIGTIDINVGLMSLGVDSMMIEKLRTSLCEVFDPIEITPAEMYEYVSVKELCKMVEHKLSMKYFPTEEIIGKDKVITYNQELTTKYEVKSDLNEGKQKSDFTSPEGPDYTEFIEENDIAIISMSGSFSGCETVEELWDGLLNGKELTSTIANNTENNSDQDNFDDDTDANAFIPVSGIVPNTEKFDSALFQLSQEDAAQLDFQTKNFLQHAYLCLEKSGYIKEKRKYKIGCFVGAEPMPASEMNTSDENRGSLINMYKQNQKDFIAMWTSHILDLNGPSAAVYSACSSSLLAIRHACDAIQHKNADLCLTGAVHLVHPEDIGHHFQPGIVLSSTSHCRPFSFSSDAGIIRGSACAAVLLKDAKNAYLDGDNILGVIKSCRLNNDGGRGNKSNFMAPSLRGQTESMRSVFDECISITPNDISYLEAHGTGTPVGDSIEIKAMTEVYGKRENPLTIGSIKANIGHCFAASGMASLAKCLKILETKSTPPQLIEDESAISELPNKIRMAITKETLLPHDSKPLYVAMNNFGIGGTNASVIMMEGSARFKKSAKKLEPNKTEEPLISDDHLILPISAATRESCQRQCESLNAYMSKFMCNNSIAKRSNRERAFLQKIANSWQNHRDNHRYRIAFVVRTVDEAISKLSSFSDTDIIESMDESEIRDKLSFFFCPQGVQYPGILQKEMAGSAWIERIVAHLCTYYSANSSELMEMLSSDKIDDARFTQCGLLVVCRAISLFLKEVGIPAPNVVFGHSLGEYSALVEAGVLDIDQCMKLLKVRGQLISQTAQAKMIIVHEDNGNIHTPQDLEVSARLSSSIRVLVGPPASVDLFTKTLKTFGIEHRILRTFHGFHSSFLEPIREEFRKEAHKLTFRPADCRIISNTYGEYLDNSRLNADYLCEHLIQPVRIDLSLENLVKKSQVSLVVEIGPPGMLQNLLESMSAQFSTDRFVSVVHTATSRKESLQNPGEIPLFNTVAKLWAHGCNVNFKRLCGTQFGVDYEMPGYQFHLSHFPCELVRHVSEIRSRNMKTYKMGWKLVKNFECIQGDYKPCPTNEETTLCFTPLSNIEPKALFGANFPVIKVELVESAEKVIQKIDSTHFQISTDDESFAQLSKTLSMQPKIAIYLAHTKIHPESCNSAVKQTYFVLQQILRHFSSINQIICMGLLDSAEDSSYLCTTLGQLSEIQNRNPECRCVSLEAVGSECVNFIPNCLSFFLRTTGIQSKIRFNFPLFRLHNDILLQMFYEEEQLSKPEGTLNYDEKVFLIFGGSGSIGKTYAKTIIKIFPGAMLIFVSRNVTKHEKVLKKAFSKCQFFNVDIGEQSEVHSLMQKISEKTGNHIDGVIHCAGRPTLNTLFKNESEVKSVLREKVTGTVNILEAITQNGIHVDCVVLNSSLTAVNGLAGNEDYATANLFLDAIANRVPFVWNAAVDRIVSVQWPAWRSSNMFQQSDLIHDHVILEHSIEERQAQKIIREILMNDELQGVIAVANTNPINIRRFLMERQEKDMRNNNTVGMFSIKQQLPADIKSVIGELWKTSLLSNQKSKEIVDSDNFFHLGGNSLNGIRLVWRIERVLGRRVPLQWLFEFPQFGAFFRKIEEHTQSPQDNVEAIKVSDIPRCNRLDRIPLSLAQEQMWILWNLEKETVKISAKYNIVFKIELRGEVDRTALMHALMLLTANDTSLRTKFCVDEHGQPYQEIMSLTSAYHELHWEDASIIEEAEIKENQWQFDLTESVPFRIRTFCGTEQTSSSTLTILLNCHHILTDGWSMSVLAEKLSAYYKSYTNHRPKSDQNIDKSGIVYADYAVWNRQQFKESAIESKCSALAQIFDQCEPSCISHIDTVDKTTELSHVSQISIMLSEEENQAIQDLAARLHTTPYVIFLTAFARSVDIWRENSWDYPDVVIGCPISGRDAIPQVAQMIGYFLNNIVLRLPSKMLWNDNVEIIIKKVKESIDNAKLYSDVPFHGTVGRMKSRINGGGNPVFDIFFNFRHNLEFPNVQLGHNVSSKVDQLSTNRIFQLSCTIDELRNDQSERDVIRIIFDYDPYKCNSASIHNFSQDFLRQIKALAHGNGKITSVVSNLQKGPEKDWPMTTTLIEAIHRQAQITPGKIAISREIDNNGALQLNYADLLKRIQRNAKFLQDSILRITGRALRPDDVIPIMLENNVAVEWILSVLEAGAAYSIIDLNTPMERVGIILTQIGTNFIVTTANALPDGVQKINISHIDKDLQMISSEKVKYSKAKENDLAYVCFTSGSTGTPKGVCVEHRNVMSFIAGASQQLGLNDNSRIAHSVNCAFDVSVFNIFGALMNGGCLVQYDSLAKHLEINDKREKYTHFFLPSAIFNCLGASDLEEMARITDHLIVGGETPITESIRKCLHTNIRMTQIYGPTETTVWSLCHRITVEQSDGSIIGLPCANESVFLLPRAYSRGMSLQFALPIDSLAIGELCIMGDGVARGYLNSRAESESITKPDDKFVLSFDGKRVYRTGDLVRRDREIYRYIARQDTQMKVRGIRVDGKEIANVIQKELKANFQAETTVLVTVEECPSTRVKELVAFLALNPSYKISQKALVSHLKASLTAKLPPHLVPAYIIIIEKIPISFVGKNDKKALSKIFHEFYEENRGPDLQYYENHPELSQKIVRVWQQVLPANLANDVTLSGSFFAHGGNSLLLFLLKAKLTEEFPNLNPRLTIEDLFRNASITEQIQLIEQRSADLNCQEESHSHKFSNVNVNCITLLRDPKSSEDDILNVYCIHAIGGTVYPYYSMLHILPRECRIFGIYYHENLPFDSLDALANFYADQILSHSKSAPFLLMGHSLGGILARETGIILSVKSNLTVPFVVCFDSWIVGTDSLDLQVVQNYLERHFQLMPESEKLMKGAMRLAKMLKMHSFTNEHSLVGIRLFKAKLLGDSALKNSIRENLDPEMLIEFRDNGWSRLSQSVQVYLVNGDHDSILRAENMAPFSSTFQTICNEIRAAFRSASNNNI